MEYPIGLGNDCGIVAIAALTGKPYDEVKDWFKTKNNHPAQWRGRTSIDDYMDALTELGKPDSYKLHTLLRPMPLHMWSRIYCRRYPGKKFLVASTRHTMAVQDGIVLDNTDVRHVNEHPSKGSRIKNAWMVE